MYARYHVNNKSNSLNGFNYWVIYLESDLENHILIPVNAGETPKHWHDRIRRICNLLNDGLQMEYNATDNSDEQCNH